MFKRRGEWMCVFKRCGEWNCFIMAVIRGAKEKCAKAWNCLRKSVESYESIELYRSVELCENSVQKCGIV